MRKIFNITPGIYTSEKTIMFNESQSDLKSGMSSPGDARVIVSIKNKNNTYIGSESFEDYIVLEDGNMIELE